MRAAARNFPDTSLKAQSCVPNTVARIRSMERDTSWTELQTNGPRKKKLLSDDHVNTTAALTG
jgi:hypothetical protein